MSGLITRLRWRTSERPQSRPVSEDEVMAAAVDLAFDIGLHAVTVSAVAERISVAVPAVARHAVSDTALKAAVYQRVVAAELAEVKRLVLAYPTVLAQLQVLATLLAEPVRAEVTAVWLEGWSLGRSQPPLAAVVRGEMEAWQVFISGIIRRAIREGLALPVDPEFVAAQLIGMIDGVNSYALVGYRTELDRARLVRAVLERELGVNLADAGTHGR